MKVRAHVLFVRDIDSFDDLTPELFRQCSIFCFSFYPWTQIDHDLSRTPWLNSGLWRGVCCSSICLLLWLIFVFCFVPKFVYVVRLLMLYDTWAISCFISEVCGVRVFWYLFIFVPVYIFLLEEKLEDIKEEIQILAWDWYKDVSICWLPLARFWTAQRYVYLLIAPCSLLNGTQMCLFEDCKINQILCYI